MGVRDTLTVAVGIKLGKIQHYDQALIDEMSKVIVNGVPLSLLLLHKDTCEKENLKYAIYMAIAIKGECKVKVIQSKNGEKAVVEKTQASGTYIYDIETGLRYDKNYFDIVKRPTLKKLIEKSEIINRADTTISGEGYATEVVNPIDILNKIKQNSEAVQEYYKLYFDYIISYTGNKLTPESEKKKEKRANY